MLLVGLTGNIGSGKSTATQILSELGAHIIDADAIVHQLLVPESDTYRKVVRAFGGSILREDRTIDRKSLGRTVFSSPAKLELLNSLVHPDVRREILRRVRELEQADQAGVAVVDAALMVETGFYRQFDIIIVVTCTPDLQLERIMRRNSLREEEARARMDAQMSAHRKAAVADFVIDNSGTVEETRLQLERVYGELLIKARGR